MKIKDLIRHSHLDRGQYITVTEHTNRDVRTTYSSKDIGRYDFGRDQEKVLGLTVDTFRPTEYGIHIDAHKKNTVRKSEMR